MKRTHSFCAEQILSKSQFFMLVVSFMILFCTITQAAPKITQMSGQEKIWSLSYSKICGPYSVGALLRFFKRRLPFNDVCSLVNFDPDKGTSVKDIQDGLNASGLQTLFVKTTLSECLAYDMPMIFCLKNPAPKEGDPPYHLVAAIPDIRQKEGHLLVLTKGARPFSPEKLLKSGWWTGEVILVSDHPFETKYDVQRNVKFAGMGGGAAIIFLAIGIHFYNRMRTLRKK